MPPPFSGVRHILLVVRCALLPLLGRIRAFGFLCLWILSFAGGGSISAFGTFSLWTNHLLARLLLLGLLPTCDFLVEKLGKHCQNA